MTPNLLALVSGVRSANYGFGSTNMCFGHQNLKRKVQSTEDFMGEQVQICVCLQHG